MIANGHALGLCSDGGCYYDNAVDMLAPIIKSNLGEIKEMRMNGNCDMLSQKLGKENFETIAALANKIIDDDFFQIRGEIDDLCNQYAVSRRELSELLTGKMPPVKQASGNHRARKYYLAVKDIMRVLEKRQKQPTEPPAQTARRRTLAKEHFIPGRAFVESGEIEKE